MTKPQFTEAKHVLPELEKTHHVVKMEPSHDAKLRYALPIPKGWGRATALGGAEPKPGMPEPIGVFSLTQDLAGPRVIVTAQRMRWEVDPLEWVRYHFIRSGWDIAVARWLDAPREGRFEIGATRRTNGIDEVRRATGFLDTGRLIRVDAAAPLSVWPRVHDMLWPAGILFELHEPTGRQQIEARPRRRGPGINFRLPKSWRARAGAHQGRLQWLADVEADVLQCAALRIDVTSPRRAAPLQQRQRAIATDLRDSGFTIDPRAEPISPYCGEQLEGWRGLHRFTAGDKQGERFEVRLAHRETPTCAIDYVMLAPEPGRHHLDWMRATKALEMAIATTKVIPA